MMRLRQIVRVTLPALLMAISLLVPALHAATPRHVKHKVYRPPLHAVPPRPPEHAVLPRPSVHSVARRKITHKVPSRRAKKYRRTYHSRTTRFRMPARPSPDRIDQIQQALARTGFYQGDPSGKWDSDTVDAMKNFQQARGLAPTGKIDAESLQQLGLGSDIAGLAPPQPLIAADRPSPGDQ